MKDRQPDLFDVQDGVVGGMFGDNCCHCDALPVNDPGLHQGKAARDEAIRLVGEAAPVDFKDAALAVIRDLAGGGRQFTSDDVWERIPEGVRPPEPRALGAIMVQAARLGIIRATDNFKPSNRPQNHANPKRVWRAASRQEQAA